MPLNGNTYVAPTWRNGQPPALDPAELQAISDSIVRNQTDNANQAGLIAALQTVVSALQAGSAKIEVGSYVGTGTYGAENPNSITCSFTPKLIIVAPEWNGSYGFTSDIRIGIYNGAFFATLGGNHSDYAFRSLTFLTEGNAFKWYDSSGNAISSKFQLNSKNYKYMYVIIG